MVRILTSVSKPIPDRLSWLVYQIYLSISLYTSIHIASEVPRLKKNRALTWWEISIRENYSLTRFFQFDEDRDFDLGDITVPVGAQAKITLTDNTAFYYLAYNYALFDDKRNSLFASFGFMVWIWITGLTLRVKLAWKVTQYCETVSWLPYLLVDT